ncbi:MAG: dihydropteroate synthase [Pirellulales bacterium]|nr:dihydropteroate synthase [Pirellulales bacterium]
MPHIHFVTGRLAAPSLRTVVVELAARVGFEFTIDVLPIGVAALMTPQWIARHLQLSPHATQIMLPGYCEGDLSPVEIVAGNRLVVCGPRDLRRLHEYFTGQPAPSDYGKFDIEIIAEINHCPRLSLAEVLATAEQLAADGADVIDVGCIPGAAWSGVGDCVKALRDAGHRTSIDSMNPLEIESAVRAGAELVLSVNSSNRAAARDWGCEVVAIPDTPCDLDSLATTVSYLANSGVRLRMDPVLEPIGYGFAASLRRYWEVRERFPDAKMLMGIGNLTELTDADSAAINVLLLGICEELGIRSVLTTQVVNWASSSVRECDLARRLVFQAVQHRMLPKHLEPRLVMLRDEQPLAYGEAELAQLAAELKDHNYRIFAENGKIHLVSAGLHLAHSDPFDLFQQLARQQPKNLDASHAFYLGYEMAKALTALTLSKEYRQDESLDWGLLTRLEASHRPRQSPLPPDWDGRAKQE